MEQRVQEVAEDVVDVSTELRAEPSLDPVEKSSGTAPENSSDELEPYYSDADRRHRSEADVGQLSTVVS